jgi:cytochrome c-type biogenesis protein CcmF
MAVPFGPTLAWKRGDVLAAAERLYAVAGLALLATVATAATMWRGPWIAPFGIGLAVWLIAGAVSDIAFRAKLLTAGREEGLRRLVNLPRAAFGTMLGHIGVGVTLLGIVATSAWQSERIVALRPGDKIEIAGYEIVFKGLAPRQGPNYVERIAALDVLVGGVKQLELAPSKRNFPAERQTTTEAGIHASALGDLYAVLGDEQPDGAHAFRIYYNPLVRLIWIGAVVMFLGGLLSLSDRRLRVGAPRQSRRPALAAAE